MRQPEDETQIYKEKEYIADEDGYYIMDIPDGAFKISTGAPEQKTGEQLKYPVFVTSYFSSDITPNLSNVSDLFEKVDLLKSEIDELRKENLEIKQRFDELYNQPKVIEIKELPDNKIEKKILKYLKKNRDKVVYPSEIAFKFNLDAKKVFNICQKLKKESKIV